MAYEPFTQQEVYNIVNSLASGRQQAQDQQYVNRLNAVNTQQAEQEQMRRQGLAAQAAGQPIPQDNFAILGSQQWKQSVEAQEYEKQKYEAGIVAEITKQFANAGDAEGFKEFRDNLLKNNSNKVIQTLLGFYTDQAIIGVGLMSGDLQVHNPKVAEYQFKNNKEIFQKYGINSPEELQSLGTVTAHINPNTGKIRRILVTGSKDKAGDYYIRTEIGPDGKPHDYEFKKGDETYKVDRGSATSKASQQSNSNLRPVPSAPGYFYNSKIDPSTGTGTLYRVDKSGKLVQTDERTMPDNLRQYVLDYKLASNPMFRQQSMTAEILPEMIDKVVEAGTKLNYSDAKFIGMVQEFYKGQINDPEFTAYMNLRNDTIMEIASVMRSRGMTDLAHRAEIEVTSPTMSPRALAAWAQAQKSALGLRIKKYQDVIGDDGTKRKSDQSRYEKPFNELKRSVISGAKASNSTSFNITDPNNGLQYQGIKNSDGSIDVIPVNAPSGGLTRFKISSDEIGIMNKVENLVKTRVGKGKKFTFKLQGKQYSGHRKNDGTVVFDE